MVSVHLSVANASCVCVCLFCVIHHPVEQFSVSLSLYIIIYILFYRYVVYVISFKTLYTTNYTSHARLFSMHTNILNRVVLLVGGKWRWIVNG